MDLESRLRDYNLDDTLSPQFATNSLTDKLITVKLNEKREIMEIPARASTLFLAVPTTEVETSARAIFEKAREIFELNRWYNQTLAGAEQPRFRYYSSKIFPLRRTVKTEQNAIVIEDTDQGVEGNYFTLRINHRGEVSFATSYYTVSEYFETEGAVFHLGGIIHLLWSFLCLVKEFQEHLDYIDNYHICVSMSNTNESFLGDFADGWPDVRKGNYIRGPKLFDEICYQSNILIRRENVNLSVLEYKIEPEIIKDIAEEIARAYNQQEARCFDNDTGKLPDKLWPVRY